MAAEESAASIAATLSFKNGPAWLRQPPHRIVKTEERGITIRQLRCVWAEIQRRCVPEQWVAVRPSSEGWVQVALTPGIVNLYDVDKYLIRPATVEHKCALVELMAKGPQKPKWFVSHFWAEPVKDFLACLEQHAKDRGTWKGTGEHGDKGESVMDEDMPYWICAYVC